MARHETCSADETVYQYNIVLAVDYYEGAEFAAWLNEHGHNASVGRTTENTVDGRLSAWDQDARGILTTLWNQYCA